MKTLEFHWYIDLRPKADIEPIRRGVRAVSSVLIGGEPSAQGLFVTHYYCIE